MDPWRCAEAGKDGTGNDSADNDGPNKGELSKVRLDKGEPYMAERNDDEGNYECEK